MNTANLVLVDQARPISGLVSFADNLEVKDVTSDLGVLDGCDLLQVCKAAFQTSNYNFKAPFNEKGLYSNF